MAEMRFDPVLFDFDGTVVDSGAIILASMRHAAETVLGEAPPDERLLAAVGGPGLIAQMEALDATRVDELVRVYREHNVGLHDGLACCLGMEDVLTRLKGDGRTLGIVTAKSRSAVALAFERLPIEQFFDVVVTGDDTDRHKPDPDPILLALERLDAQGRDAVYVGDSPFDVRAAKAAGVHAIAVTWGRMHARDRLEREAPDAIVETAEELLGHLE
jgi:pyrophosphatase PpaX